MRGAGAILLGGSAAAAMIAATRTSAPLMLQNVTPSLPKGFYVREVGAIRKGAIVAFRQPERARAYLTSLGYPANALLLKRVVASEGDVVCALADRVRLAERTAFRAQSDRKGVALPLWNGCRRLNAGELFAFGDTPTSFDSRYFGPVSASLIVGRYRRWL